MASNSIIFAWKFPRTEGPAGLQSRGCKVLDTTECTHTFTVTKMCVLLSHFSCAPSYDPLALTVLCLYIHMSLLRLVPDCFHYTSWIWYINIFIKFGKTFRLYFFLKVSFKHLDLFLKKIPN